MRFLLAFTALILAQSAHATSLCYPSGFRIAIVERPGREQLAIATDVAGGSTAELAGEYGGAHLIEHLWFQTPQEAYSDVNALYADIGATTNAYTTRDSTQYLTVANQRFVNALLSVEIDRLINPLRGIDETMLEVEKDIVHAELHQRTEGLASSPTLLKERLLQPGNPYRRSAGATPAQVAELTLPALRRYTARQYKPQHTSMVIMSDLPASHIRRTLTALLPPSLAAHADHPDDVTPVPCDASLFERRRASEPQPIPDVVASWEAAEAATDQETAVFGWVLPAVAHTGMRYGLTSAMLAWHINRNLDANTQVNCGTDELDTQTIVQCFVTTHDERAIDTRQLEHLIRSSKSMWSSLGDTSSQQQSQWVARVFADRWLADRDIAVERLDVSPYGYLSQSSTQFRRTNTLRDPPSPALEDIAETGRVWLLPEQARSLMIHPPKNAHDIVGEQHGSRGQSAVRTRDPERVTADYLSRFVVEPDLSLLRIKTLPNGLTIWVLPDEQLNRTRAALLFRGDARWIDDPTGTLTAFGLLESTDDLAFRLFKGAHLTGGTRIYGHHRTDHWAYYLTTGRTEEWVVQVMAVLGQSLGRPASKKDTKQYWADFSVSRKRALENPQAQAYWQRYRTLGPNLDTPFDPAAEQSARQMTRGKAKAMGKTVFQPGRAHLLIVGPVQEEEIISRVSQYLRQWDQTEVLPDQRTEMAPPEDIFTPDRTVFVMEDDRPRAQATIGVGCHVDDGNSTASWVLERALNQDLNTALRGERGLTYGVYARMSYPPHGATLNIDTQLPHAEVGNALHALFDTLASAATDGLPANRLAQLKVEAARGTVIHNQDGDELLGLLQWWATRPAEDTDDEDRPDFGERLAQLTPEVMSQAVSSCAGHEAVTLVGDVDALTKTLMEAKIDHVVLDWKTE